MCFVCDRFKSMKDQDLHLAEVKNAFIWGFAIGFNVRKDATFMETCSEHAQMLTAALLEAGSKPIPISPGGQA